MRTIKFLGLAVALAAVSVSANAQAGRRFDHFSGINDLARLEARQIERHQMRRGAMARAPRMGHIRGMQRGARPGVMLRRSLAMRGPMGMRGGRIAGPPRGRQIMAGRMGPSRAFQGGRHFGMRLGARAGFRAGFRAGSRAGIRAGTRANATPEQKELTRQFREKRQALRARVQAGTLTREQARAQMKAWTTEHRPKK